jgi:hypothetical protein
MALDFTTAVLDPRVTFTRTGNTATVTNSSGVIVAINADLPRFDFNPTTLVCNGLLIEESRTNLLLNSLLNGTNLSTQLVTTTAVAHTLSFYGTGQIVLTGTSSATVIGTGVYPARQTLTFTPTVGVLTLTVTGTVQYAQLEVGSFPTSFIPTAGSQVTRTADIAVMTGTNFSDWYNQPEGSLGIQFVQPYDLAGNKSIAALSAATNANQAVFLTVSAPRAVWFVNSGGSTVASVNAGNLVLNAVTKQVATLKLNDMAMSVNAAAVAVDTVCAMPIAMDRFFIGSSISGLNWTGWVQKINYYPQRLINAELQAFSK